MDNFEIVKNEVTQELRKLNPNNDYIVTVAFNKINSPVFTSKNEAFMLQQGPFSIYVYRQNKPIQKLGIERQKAIRDVLELYTSN